MLNTELDALLGRIEDHYAKLTETLLKNDPELKQPISRNRLDAYDNNIKRYTQQIHDIKALGECFS